MKKYFLYFITFVVMSIVVIACNSAKQTTSGDEYSDKQNKNGRPDFMLNLPKSDTVFYGTGSANLADFDASRAAALASARVNISGQVNTAVKSSLQTTFQQSGMEKAQADKITTQVSKTTSENVLKGSIPEKMSEGDDGTIYALVSFPKANIIKEVTSALEKVKKENNVEIDTEKATETLEQELDKPVPAPDTTQ